MHSPQLLILDEPSSGLDPNGQQIFLDMVAEASGNGQTVLMSSHIMIEVEAVTDRGRHHPRGETGRTEHRARAAGQCRARRGGHLRRAGDRRSPPPSRAPRRPGGRHHPALPRVAGSLDALLRRIVTRPKPVEFATSVLENGVRRLGVEGVSWSSALRDRLWPALRSNERLPPRQAISDPTAGKTTGSG
ncbi:hypothetical protein ABZ511_27485 [Nocardia gamkensis]